MDLKKYGVTKLLRVIRVGYHFRAGGSKTAWNVERSYRKLADKIVNANTCGRFRNAADGEGFNSEEHARWHAEVMFAASEFANWVCNCPEEAELWMVMKSPNNLARLAVVNDMRLYPSAESILIEKAKDQGGLLEYCTKFGVVLADLTTIMVKASFDGKAYREKAYVRKIVETKRSLKSFLEQMVKTNQMDSSSTVAEIISSL